MGCVAKRSSVIKHEKKKFLFCVNFFFVFLQMRNKHGRLVLPAVPADLPSSPPPTLTNELCHSVCEASDLHLRSASFLQHFS